MANRSRRVRRTRSQTSASGAGLLTRSSSSALLLSAAFQGVFVFSSKAADADAVPYLPGFGTPPSQHFSGFLDATAGCDTDSNGPFCKLHYWFATKEDVVVERDHVSEKDAAVVKEDSAGVEQVITDTTSSAEPEHLDENTQQDEAAVFRKANSNSNARSTLLSLSKSKKDHTNANNHAVFADKSIPVILWLNGGPGSSSLIGFLQENGPLMMNATGGFMRNPYAWTKVGHLLAIEQPLGVGFSYCANSVAEGSKKKLCKNRDKTAASMARAAVVDFFTSKFPELRDNPFIITGESYAGVYIPTISKQILDWNKKPSTGSEAKVNLVAIGVGDPCTDNDAQANAMDALWYAHKNGFVPDQDFDFLWNTCKARVPTKMSVWREKIKARGFRVVRGAGVADALVEMLPRMPSEEFRVEIPGCRGAWRRFLLSASNAFSQGWSRQWINPYALYSPSGVTSEDDAMAAWLNRKDVQKALHVEEAKVAQWPQTGAGFDYSQDYAACNQAAEPGAPSMLAFYRDIAPQLKVTLVYNGDADPCVSYEGTRLAMTRVGFKELDGGSYRPWFYKKTKADAGLMKDKAVLFGPFLVEQEVPEPQFGGEIVNYEHGLSFLTFHGSGHMVPQFKPIASLHFLKTIVKTLGTEGHLLRGDGNKMNVDEVEHPFFDLSPLMPSNTTLETVSDEEFAKMLNSWTDTAKQR
ncbi:unnamed protein product [Amoebophrya sp. A25]|nr:unnamed protein product [Amoebophrya sp. A25]|eukprot:GSA25T00014414001.1